MSVRVCKKACFCFRQTFVRGLFRANFRQIFVRKSRPHWGGFAVNCRILVVYAQFRNVHAQSVGKGKGVIQCDVADFGFADFDAADLPHVYAA
uniref:Uncharacterized protein n=1 Tax=Ackermannviridae sp. TaxID=2831612 RepID=A0A8S5RQR5_9CAUD|nr:MAG TPA: hypothetical protein [Ackermannviridae sp.]